MYVWNRHAQHGKIGVNGRRVPQSVISEYQHENVYVMGISVPVLITSLNLGNKLKINQWKGKLANFYSDKLHIEKMLLDMLD